ncbi:MAG: hypothetical protein GC200_08380 [Tepidisphaera sp.]|nr:hypothetical protein [Tepidisphaera sp.]
MKMRRLHVCGFGVAAGLGALLSGGCTVGDATEASAPIAGAPAFAPATLRIHPLTHIEKGPQAGLAAGQCTVVLHLELKDRFGDSVKGLGTLRVELFKPGAGVSPGIESQALSWDVNDLAEAEGNSRRFDQSTRTYRIPLVAPAWVAEWGKKDASGASQGYLKLRAVLTTTEGPERYLEDEFVLAG